jgi:hypothetical protein
MRLLRASLVISLAAAGASGCADQGNSQIIVLNHQIPEEGCVLTSTEGDTFLGSGRVDALGVLDDAAATGYLATPLIKNVSDSADGTLETERTVILHGARVDLVIGSRTDGTALLSADQLAELQEHNALQFTIPFSGAVTPDGGVAVVSFDAIPRETLYAIGMALSPGFPDEVTSDTALVQIVYRIFGETTAGGSVESDPFSFPVTVCTGCLFLNIGACTEIPDGEYSDGGECNMFQDGVTQCCQRADLGFVCPAVPEDPPA